MNLLNKTLFGLAAIFSLLSSTHAQPLSIDWHKIAGDGGTSTGGVYSVSGTMKFIIVSPPSGNRFFRLISL